MQPCRRFERRRRQTRAVRRMKSAQIGSVTAEPDALANLQRLIECSTTPGRPNALPVSYAPKRGVARDTLPRGLRLGRIVELEDATRIADWRDHAITGAVPQEAIKGAPRSC